MATVAVENVKISVQRKKRRQEASCSATDIATDRGSVSDRNRSDLPGCFDEKRAGFHDALCGDYVGKRRAAANAQSI